MMKHIFVSLLVCLFSFVSVLPLFPQTWVSIDTTGEEGDPPQIVATVSNNCSTVVDITVPGMWRSKIIVYGDTFDLLEIPEYPSTGELGQAKIPKLGKLVGIPPTSDDSLVIEYADSSILTGYHIYPVQNAFYPDPDTFFYDEDYYNTNAFLPESLITISSPYLWHDCRIVEFPINPVRYNPATGSLKVYSNIRARIDYFGTNNENAQTITRDTITPARARMYRDMIINFDFLDFTESEGVLSKYLIITDEYFASSIDNLRFWKHKKGISTTVAYLDIDVQRNDIAIRDYIKEFFETNHPLGYDIYVLLIGDPESQDPHYLPMHIYEGPLYSDHYYTCVYGEFEDDLYPDVQLGRISPSGANADADSQIVEMIANRTVDYKKNPPIGSWMEEYVLACAEGFQTDFIYKLLTQFYPGVTVTKLYGDSGATNAILESNIVEGTGILNYFGHGLPKEWTEWDANGNSWTVQHAKNLKNHNKRPLVYSASCETGAIQSDSICLGEGFMNADSGGAIGFYGYTTIVHSFGVSIHNISMWVATFPPNSSPRIYKTGDIQNYADARALSTGNPNAESVVKPAIWLGCPELSVLTVTPKTLTVNHPSNTDAGASFTVEVFDIGTPIENALVCIWKGEEVYDVKYTNSSGGAKFTIPSTATRGEMYVTVTVHNYIPYEGTARIGVFADDPLSLAYNGNKHLVREPNTDNLHLVYTDAGKVLYRYSDSGGEVWSLADNLGEGNFPAIVLDSNNNPLVTWTYGNYLFFSRKNPIQGWEQTEYTFGSLQPSHSAIVVTTPEVSDIDSVHILVRLSRSVRPYNTINELSFSVPNPQSYNSMTLESSSGGNMITLDFPSIAKDYENTLHASWMHADTIYYGTRAEGANWNVWGDRFDPEGHNSAHPFVETYGDSIFVLWQNASDNEIYRGRRYLQDSLFSWSNLSQTSTTPSIYPVNASGMVTTFVDKSSMLNNYDIFWKITPDDSLHNISNTRLIKSIFPHTSLWIREQYLPLQYTVWLEGNSSPYEIKCKESIIGYGPGKGHDSLSIPAYFTSIPGSETPSLYLTKRDSFISDWQIPVDVGYEEITYKFPLNPIYRYKFKGIAYYEGEDKWKMKVLADGEEIGEIEYEPYEPETLECLIPPAFYKDSLIEVTLRCDDGNFAALGPIYIYRYEYGEEGKGGRSGGPMLQGTVNRNKFSLTISPNPFNRILNVRFQSSKEQNLSIKVYDVTGRLVKDIYEGMINGRKVVNWHGDNNSGRTVAQGIYFLRVVNTKSNKTFCKKVLKISW